MRALAADPTASPALSLADVPEPAPARGAPPGRGGGLGQPGRDPDRRQAAAGHDHRLGRGRDGGRLGEGVTTFDVGERVVALSPNGGSFAERVTVPAEWTAPLPSACDFVTAATLPVAGVTAAGILRLGRTHAGDRVLVTGAAGGVGQFTVQLALQTRATVTGQAGSEERAAAVRDTGAEALVHPGDGSPSTASSTSSSTASAAPCSAPCSTPPPATVAWSSTATRPTPPRPSGSRPSTPRASPSTASGSSPASPGPGRQGHGHPGRPGRQRHPRGQGPGHRPLTEAPSLIADLYNRKVTGKVVITS